MIRVYDVPAEGVDTGRRMALVPVRGTKANMLVPYDAISWVSPDWDEKKEKEATR